MLLYAILILSIYRIKAQNNCPYPEWSSHQLKVYETYPYSLINASTPGLYVNESKYGVEGGQIVFVNNAFYLFITEFTGDPLFVPSNLALWTITYDDFINNNVKWTRLRTLFQSGGTCDCNSTRASLGSSISIAFNDTSSKWMLYYVGFVSCCNDSYFENRYGRIFLAESETADITSEYKDVDVILSPDGAQTDWEGLKGIASFSNPWKVSDTYYSFYGSALPIGGSAAAVGLVKSTNLYGPWIRETNNPVEIINPNNYTEQPIMYKFSDGSYGAFFDSLDNEAKGDVGYNWSPDGVNWNENCYQLLNVLPQNGVHWGTGGRTPQGMVPINETHFYLFFSGYQPSQGQRFESFGMAKVSFV